MSARPRPASTTTLWLLVVGIGITIGAVAVLLSGLFSPPGAPSPSGGVEPGGQFVELIAGVVVLAGIVFFIYYRLRNGAVSVPNRLIAPLAVTLLLLVVFVVLVRVNIIGAGGQPGTGPIGGGQNNSTGGGSGQNGTLENYTGGGTFHFLNLTVPVWVGYAILAAIVVLVTVGAVAYAIRLARRDDSDRNRPTAEGVRSALETAARALDEGSGDPRQILIELYARLLHRLEPAVGDLATRTAEEIKTYYLIRLGVDGRTAEEITNLFEIARYSSHPIGPDQVARARQVLNTAIRQLNSPRAG